MPPIKALAFDQDGVPKMLSSPEEIERAIARGDIVGGTSVTAYFDGRAPRFAPAADHPQLARYFMPDEPEPPAIESEPPVPMTEPVAIVEASPSLEPPSAESPEPEPAAAVTPLAPAPEHAAEVAAAPVQQPNPPSKSNAWMGGGLVLLLVIAALALGRCGATPRESADARGNTSERSVGTVATPPHDIQTFYALRKTPLRSIASRDGEQLGMLERGTEVHGYIVAGARDSSTQWVHITDGDHADAFVSRVNVGAAAPELLDASTAGAFFMVRESGLLDAPNGTVRRQLALGAPVEVVGTVGGFAEVTDKGGGVGYVNWSDINGDPYSTARYALNINNRCPNAKLLLLSWHQDGAWRIAADQRYTIAAGISTPLSYRHGDAATEDVIIDRPELYYYPLAASVSDQAAIGLTAKDAATIDGKPVKMIPAIPALSPNEGGTGTAIVTFEGPAC